MKEGCLTEPAFRGRRGHDGWCVVVFEGNNLDGGVEVQLRVLEMRLKSEVTLVHSCPRSGAGCLKGSGRWSNVGSGQGGAADVRGASLG